MSDRDPSLRCQQVSALLDGELSAAEADLTARRIARDLELRATAVRYCLISDVIRGDIEERSALGLVDRVAGRLEDPEQVMPDRSARWGRRLGGLAIAASVTALALVSLQAPDQPGSGDVPLAVVPDTPPPAVSPGTARRPAALTRSAGSPDRLVTYYVSHVERVAPVGVQTGFSRIVMSESDAVPVASSSSGRPEVSPE
jgi:hypothetical protein